MPSDHNRLIAALPAKDRKRLLARCETAELVLGETLCERGESLGIKREQDHRFMYFI